MTQAILLLGPGPGFSGRAVKIEQMVNASERDAAWTTAAKEAGEDVRSFAMIRLREGAMRMIRAVTKPGMKSYDEVRALPKEQWSKLTIADLAFDGAPNHWSNLFTSKDWEILIEAYRRANEITTLEAESILGGMLLVSED